MYEDKTLICKECGAKDPNYVEPTPSGKSTFIVKAEAGLNGKISPEGKFEVKEGKDKSFVITANEGFVIDVVTVDGKEVAKAAGKETYTLTLEDIERYEQYLVDGNDTTLQDEWIAPRYGAGWGSMEDAVAGITSFYISAVGYLGGSTRRACKRKCRI